MSISTKYALNFIYASFNLWIPNYVVYIVFWVMLMSIETTSIFGCDHCSFFPFSPFHSSILLLSLLHLSFLLVYIIITYAVRMETKDGNKPTRTYHTYTSNGNKPCVSFSSNCWEKSIIFCLIHVMWMNCGDIPLFNNYLWVELFLLFI